MQRVIIILLVLSATLANAQIKIGVKAGINFANVTNASGIKADTRTGYLVGGYITAKPKKYLVSGQKLFYQDRDMIIRPAPIPGM